MIEKEARLEIDFPKRNEQVESTHYTFRITSKAEGPVELSIDGGPWMSCREALGHWWYDFAGFQPGRHEAVARVNSAGTTHKSEAVTFKTGAALQAQDKDAAEAKPREQRRGELQETGNSGQRARGRR